jgi:hypothetical protein
MSTGDKAQTGRVGRIQRQMRRFSWICQEWPVTTRDLLAWAFPRIRAGAHREWQFKFTRGRRSGGWYGSASAAGWRCGCPKSHHRRKRWWTPRSFAHIATGGRALTPEQGLSSARESLRAARAPTGMVHRRGRGDDRLFRRQTKLLPPMVDAKELCTYCHGRTRFDPRARA